MVDEVIRSYKTAVDSYYLRDRMSDGYFLGLQDAPKNNIEFYAQREHFANWLKDSEIPPAERTKVPAEVIVARIKQALDLRGLCQCEFFNTVLAVAILESSLTNAGYGRDRRGTSNACGIMQTKWSAVMDSGFRYENYLDIVLDRNPLIGVDAGVGYLVRMFNRADGTLEERLDLAVCGYNMPGTDKDSNAEYYGAYLRALDSEAFAEFSQ